jgi:hypothetical protein
MFLLISLAWAVVMVGLGLLGGWTPGVGLILGSVIPLPGFIYRAVRNDIPFYLWLSLGPVVGLAIGMWMKKKEDRPLKTILLDPAILFIVVALPIGLFSGSRLISQGDRLHYRMHRSRYQAIADSVTKTTPRRPTMAGSFVVDTGPPVRVAFIRSGWLSDWEGIIYDPTDSLMAWQEHTAHRDVVLFNRTVLGCSRRERQWFYCGTQPPLKNPGPPTEEIDKTLFKLRDHK